MKRFVVCVLLVLLIISLPTASFASEQNSVFIRETVMRNDTLFPEASARSISSDSVSSVSNEITVQINQDKTVASVSFKYLDLSYQIELPGIATHVENETVSGYVGVYDGFISVLNKADVDEPVILDVIFDDDHLFAALTIGYASPTSCPEVCFYGDFDIDLSTISTLYVTTFDLYNAGVQNLNELDAVSARSVNVTDTVTRFQNQTAILGANEYILGYISIFHQNEVTNGDECPVNVKLNTNTGGALAYVREVLGYQYANHNAYSAIADKFIIKIASEDDRLYVVKNSEYPEDENNSITVVIPYIIIDNDLNLEIDTFEFDYLLSDFDADYGNANSVQNFLDVTWVMYSTTTGFSATQYDGNSETPTGMGVSVEFRYASNSAIGARLPILTSASIRYKYWVDTAGGPVTLHFTTNTTSKRTYLMCWPD